MNTSRLTQLQEICLDYPLRKKVLVTRSLAIGHQWLERVCCEYGRVENIDVATPYSLAERFTQLSLREKGITAITTDDTYWIIQRFMHEMAQEDAEAYVRQSMLSPGIVGCFHNAITELRQALIHSGLLTPRMFESDSKGKYLCKLLDRYEQYLTKHRLADAVELRHYVERDAQTQTLYILDRHLQLSAAEQEILHIITGDQIQVLEPDAPFTHSESSFSKVETVFFHALGPVAEIREVLRRLAENRIALDQVEIITPNAALYLPVVYTAALQHDIPCTFAGGIPIDFTVTGQAVRLYLEWLESGYHIAPILQALKLGIMRPPVTEEMVSTGSYIRILEKSGIGWGRERYELLERMISSEGGESGENGPTTNPDVIPAKKLAEWFNAWFTALPIEDDSWTPSIIAEGLRMMMESVPKRNEDEAGAQAAILQLVKTLSNAKVHNMDRSIAIRYMREKMEQLTFGSHGIPSEGKIHVSSLQNGGQSGRPYTFIVGMDQKSWKISTDQDPILLDEERKRIGSYLATAKELAECNERARSERLGAIRGQCTMSFSSYGITDKQERNAAFELLLCYRQKSGNTEAGYDELIHALPPAVGVLYSNGPISLDSQEVWMNALVSEDRFIRNGIQGLLTAYPSLKEGQQALRNRIDPMISAYDGVFNPAHYDSVPGVTSVSKLEMFARCSLQYFFHEVLRVRPKELVEFDRSRWLDAAQRGTLLHAIFQQYWTETNEYEGIHDRSRLERITERCLQNAKVNIPAPSEHVMSKECEHIRRDVSIFWSGELRRNSRPRYMELALHSVEGPFAVELGEGLTLSLRGFVDRVDEVAPHTYKILDYKTGSSRKYSENEYFAEGTQLQHTVYATAVEQWLRFTGADLEARVIESGYYFPTYQGQGHEITRIQNRSMDTSRLVGSMMDAMRQGIFPPTKDVRQCSWCHYSTVCGQHAEYMKEKRGNSSNADRLSPLMEVESYA